MKAFIVNTLFQIDGKKHLILLSFLSNLFEGLAFAHLLQIPYNQYFSKLFTGSNQLALVAFFLFCYRLGRLIISLSDSKLPYYFHKNGFMIAMAKIGFGLFLISISQLYSYNFIFVSAFLFGIGTTLSGLNLREILTNDTDLAIKRKFNILSNIGWSIGVGISGFILNNFIFKFEAILGIFLIVIAAVVSLKKEESTLQPDKVNELRKLNASNKDILFLFAMTALMTGLISNQINSSIMSQVTGTFHIKEGFQSLVLLLPIIGGLLSWVPKINLFFNRSFTFLGIGVLNLLYLCILILLTLSTNLIFYCLLLCLVGFFSNEIMTAVYHNVAIKQVPELRRATHALIETVMVLGSLLTWIFSKIQITNLVLNFSLILIAPAVLLLFLSDFKLLFKERSIYDKAN